MHHVQLFFGHPSAISRKFIWHKMFDKLPVVLTVSSHFICGQTWFPTMPTLTRITGPFLNGATAWSNWLFPMFKAHTHKYASYKVINLSSPSSTMTAQMGLYLSSYAYTDCDCFTVIVFVFLVMLLLCIRFSLQLVKCVATLRHKFRQSTLL